YAVPDRDLEKEAPMPPGQYSGKVYGRLSYAWNSLLRNLKAPINYRELGQHLHWKYQAFGWYPAAFVVGTDLDRAVLGRKVWENRSEILVKRRVDGELEINVGLINQVDVGSKFAVHVPAGNAAQAKPVGYVEVIEVTMTHSLVRPCGFEKTPAIPLAQLPVPGRCELAELVYEEARITVKPIEFRTGKESRQELAKLKTQRALAMNTVRVALHNIANEKNSIVRLAPADQLADLYLLVRDNDVFLRKTNDSYVDEALEQNEFLGPFPIDGSLNSKLSDVLLTAGRALNLRKLAHQEMDLQAGDPAIEDLFRLDIQFEKHSPRDRHFKVVSTTDLQVKDRDVIRVSVTNKGRAPIDVNMLYVESGFAIRSMFPTRNQVIVGDFNNRLMPNGDPAVTQIRINDSTLGLEDLIIIATSANQTGVPAEFVFLEQNGLKPSRGKSLVATRGSLDATPLDKLLDRSLYEFGNQRSATSNLLGQYAIRRHSWTVEPKDK
ncbi:MAG: hypothetical protein KDA84_15115, partial [Planctomycetaceae bacterium]|nr:hypothetical protein [Planctomycetaceae bacterium]